MIDNDKKIIIKTKNKARKNRRHRGETKKLSLTRLGMGSRHGQSGPERVYPLLVALMANCQLRTGPNSFNVRQT